MVANTPTPPETPCELCQDKTALTMTSYAATAVACQAMDDENSKKSCLELIIPLEKGDKNVDPVEVLADVMLLDSGIAIDKFAGLASALIEKAAMRAVEKRNALETPA